MRILFTKADLIGSKVIRWGLDEPVSHVALEADNLVLHSTWGAVDLDSKNTFLKHREVVYSVWLPAFGVKDLLVLADRYEGSKYDFRGLVYFGAMALRRKLFNTPLPRTNRLNTPGNFLCTELATLLLWGVEDGIITPYELYLKLKEQYNGRQS